MTRRLARGSVLLGVGLLVTGLALSPWDGYTPVPAHLGDWLAQLVDAIAFGFVGIAVAERATDAQRRVGGVLLVTGLCQAGTFATSAYLARSGGAPAVVHWLDGWLWAPGLLAVLVLLPLLFPTGLPERGFGRIAVAALALAGAATVVAAYGALPGHTAPAAAVLLVVLLAAACSIAGLASLVLRHRRGDGRVRGQVRWLAWALLLLIALELAVPLLPAQVAQALLLVLPATVPAAVGLAVLRYGLFDIDLLLSRTLVYLLLSGVLLTGYVSVVLLVSHRAGAATRTGFLAVLVVALVASPLRDLLQRLVRRRFWGPSADRQRALAELTRRLGASPSARESPGIVAQALAEALRSPVRLLAGDRVVAVTGPEGEALREVPVAYSVRRVGAIRLGGRGAGALEPREERMLADAAVALGPVLDSVLVGEDLVRERERVITARDSERERLHRDLHDGLGPTLAGLTLGVDAARNLVRSDPSQAEATLDRLGQLAGLATAEVRRVVDGLRPRALVDGDLVAAIRQQTELEGVEPRVVLRAQALVPLSHEVEDALLRVVLEAVTNVRRHAGASRCEVGLGVHDGIFELVVDDDGRGLLAASHETGVGLGSMRTRVTGLGGSLRLSRSPLGGTRVLARIPLEQSC